MGLRGPPPKPTADLEAAGSWRAKARTDIGIKPSEPVAPPWLSDDGKVMFQEYANKYKSILTTNDSLALALLVQAELDFIYIKSEREKAPSKDNQKLCNEAQAIFYRMLREFGLTPATRGSIPRENEKSKLDAMKEKFFGNKH